VLNLAQPIDIRTTLLFNLELKVGEIRPLGKTPLGNRRVAVVEGGSFEDPKLKGTVLKGGSDWLISRPDGALQLDVRLTLKTDDGHLIGMIYRGYRHGPVGRKNPIREASFVGWPETFRWDHDGCVSIRSPRASLQRFADVSVSLMPKKNCKRPLPAHRLFGDG
jgi:hypothetical protein